MSGTNGKAISEPESATQEPAKTSTVKRGKPRGTKDTLTQAEIRRLGPMAHVVMRRLLMSAFKVKDPKVAARLFDSVAPYLLRKQPQALEHSGEINHTFNRLVVEEVSDEAYVNGNGELHES